MSTDTIGITQIGQIALRVDDLARAVAFYRDVLELPFLFSTGELAFFQCGEVRLLLSRPETASDDQASSIIYYKVADIQQAYARLLERKVKFIDQPHLIAKMPDHELWMVFCYDTEANTLALMAEVRE